MTSVACSPTQSMVDGFVLAIKHMEQLMAYIEWGRNLPDNAEDYSLDLELAEATATQFKKEITMIVGVYSNIKGNCVHFKDDILPSTVELCNGVAEYSGTALGTHRIFYRKLVELDKAIDLKNASAEPDKATDSKDSSVDRLQKAIDNLVDGNIVLLDRLSEEATKVFQDIKQFEQKTSDDDKSVRRKTSALQMEHAKFKVEKNELGRAVETITRLSDAQRNKQPDTDMAWVPIVGHVPKAALKTQEGKAAEKLIRDCFSGKKHGTTDDEIIHIQGKHMLDNLGSLSQLIRPAKTAIQLLLGFFHMMKCDLQTVKGYVERLRRPSETMDLDFSPKGPRQKKWEQLRNAAMHYQQVAFYTHPVGD